MKNGTETKQVQCGAPWCRRDVTNTKALVILETRVCRKCSVYLKGALDLLWHLALRKALPVRITTNLRNALFSSLPGHGGRFSRRPEACCARTGCSTILAVDAAQSQRRLIEGMFHVCHSCYQAAWERSKHEQISILQAFLAMPRKYARRIAKQSTHHLTATSATAAE